MDEVGIREHLSSLRGLLILSMLMVQQEDEDQILYLTTTAIPSLARARCEAIHLDGNWHDPSTPQDPELKRVIEAQLSSLAATGGSLEIPGRAWSWAYSLRARGGTIGWLIVSADQTPTEHEAFVLRTLAQQIGVSLKNARMHVRSRVHTRELHVAIDALKRAMDIHSRLTKVALSHPGQIGIARALFELTGLDVAIEDAHGNLRAWAGGSQPDPYPKLPAMDRERIIRSALEAEGPFREQDRLMVVARPGEDILGVLALFDPDKTAGAGETFALEYAGTVLSMELARLRSAEDTELRLRRDLVDDLLTGADEETTLNHAQALGYDVRRPHRVVVVRTQGIDSDDELLFQAVRRAARVLRAGSLLTVRPGEVILLSDHDQPWEKLREAVVNGLRGAGCRIGVGTLCTRFVDFSRSLKEAHLALRMQEGIARGDDQVTVFENLGVFQLLGEVPDLGSIDQYIDRWLGDLIDHDEAKGTRLIETLTVYLECGGNYDATATRLFVHRSTLKGRLKRIRSISGYDLADPETRFNLELAARALKTRQAFRQS